MTPQKAHFDEVISSLNWTTKHHTGKAPSIRSISSAVTLLALLAAGGQAHAQSSVMIYGSLVDGIVYANNVGGGSVTRLASGGQWSNNWGLTGTEDLGGGLKASFNLNSSYNFNTGQTYGTNELWGGAAYVALGSDKLGTVTLGEQYDYSVDFVMYSVTASNTLFAFHPGAYDRIDGVALANTVSYESPRWAGFRAKAMYSFGSATSPTNTRRAYSASLDYENGNFKAEGFTTSVGGNTITPGTGMGAASFFGDSLLANQAQSFTLKDTDIYGAAARYDWGKFTFRSVYTKVNWFNDAGTRSQSLSNAEGSAMYKIQPDLFINAGYTYSWTVGSHWNTYDLSADYFLSKRTDVMLATNFQHAGGSGTVASLFTIGNSSTQNQLVFYAGIRHFF